MIFLELGWSCDPTWTISIQDFGWVLAFHNTWKCLRPPKGSQDLMNTPASWFSWCGDGQHDFICSWETLGAFTGTCFCCLVQGGKDGHSVWQRAKAFHMGWSHGSHRKVSVVILGLLPCLSRAYLCRWEQAELSSASWSPSWPDISWSWSRCCVGALAECSALWHKDGQRESVLISVHRHWHT